MLFSLVICSTAFAALLYGLHYLVRGGRRGKLIDKIPGPYAWPFIGNIGMFMIPFAQIWFLSRHLNKKYYPIYRLWSVTFPVVTILHPDDVGILLSSSIHIDKGPYYRFLHPWLGTGLLTSTDGKWLERRKILTPAFHFDVLQQFVGILVEQSKKIVRSLRLEGEDFTCDLIPLLHKYTINSICGSFGISWINVGRNLKEFLSNLSETTMGVTSGMDETFMNKYRSCVTEMGDTVVYRLIRPWLHVDSLFTFSEKFKKQVQALGVLHGFSKRVIKERKQYHVENRLDGGSDESYSVDSVYFKGKRRLAMLDLLIATSNSNANLDDQGIREEVDTFVFEGHDTTAMALCFALLLLAENKEIQDKARAEVDAFFEMKNTAELSMRDFQSLAYLERCLKESLRLFPAVPYMSRKLNEDLHLKNYIVPGGTVIEVHIYDIHRDPNFWPNPNVYDPDRFLPERTRGRHPFSFLPFSAGPRNCIGQKFATLEMKVLVANILKNFYLEPIDLSSEVQIIPDMVLRPASPVRLKFVQRSHLSD